jgi:hypothetical protein
MSSEAFSKNSKPKGFEEIVLTSLHTYADVFSETASQSAASGTTPLSLSVSPHPDSTKSTQ